MVFSMSLNNLKKVIAAATVFTISACLAPNYAQAGIAKGSGSAINRSEFEFYLDTSVEDQNRNDKVGVFPGAIQNFNILPGSSILNNSKICGNAICPPGNVTITKFKTDYSGNIPGLNFGLKGLQNLFESADGLEGFSNTINFSNNVDVLLYDVKFVKNNPEPALIWVIQSNDPIKDLSSLSRFSQIQGIFPSDVKLANDGSVEASGEGGVFQFSLQQVPEPTATASLVSVGTLGAVSLLKRNKRLKKKKTV
jgi:hypothetical protein